MRIRSIKPEFFRDTAIAEMQPLTRLLYQGLWLMSDCDGRLMDNVKRIKADCMPYDNCDVETMLQEMANHEEHFIIRYEVGGKKYIQVRTFHKHQRISGKEAEASSEIPPYKRERSVKPSESGEAVGKHPGSIGEAPRKHPESQEGKGREGKGKEEEESEASPSPAHAPFEGETEKERDGVIPAPAAARPDSPSPVGLFDHAGSTALTTGQGRQACQGTEEKPETGLEPMIKQLRDGHPAFKSVPNQALENAFKGWPADRWKEAIESLCRHYAGAHIPKPIKTLGNYLAGAKNQRKGKLLMISEFDRAVTHCVDMLWAHKMQGRSQEEFDQCRDVCRDNYEDIPPQNGKDVIQTAIEMITARRAAGGVVTN